MTSPLTIEQINELRNDVLMMKAIGHSSKTPVHHNKQLAVLEMAAIAAGMSELEKSAARRHMERIIPIRLITNPETDPPKNSDGPIV